MEKEQRKGKNTKIPVPLVWFFPNVLDLVPPIYLTNPFEVGQARIEPEPLQEPDDRVLPWKKKNDF
jgi:hypothetical protein